MTPIPEQSGLNAYGIKAMWSEKINDGKYPLGQKVNKKSHMVLAVCVTPNSVFGQEVFEYAKDLAGKVCATQASTGTTRTEERLLVDNFAGVLAELTIKSLIEFRYGPETVVKTEFTDAYHQIDVQLFNGETMEIRASSMRNGTKFALFHKNKFNPEQQDGDVLGPYVTGYKANEIPKDYYVRAIYPADLSEVITRWNNGEAVMFYLVGGATRAMFQDENLRQFKHMNNRYDATITPGNYMVIPMAKALDARQLFEVFDDIEGIRICHSFLDNTPDTYADIDKPVAPEAKTIPTVKPLTPKECLDLWMTGLTSNITTASKAEKGAWEAKNQYLS